MDGLEPGQTDGERCAHILSPAIFGSVDEPQMEVLRQFLDGNSAIRNV